MAGPSIKDALAGKFKEDKISAQEQHEMYNKASEKEDFTAEKMKEKWELFLERLESRPNLKATLSRTPELKDNYQLYLEIENTVQENLINSVKPELVSFLRKELRNSQINLTLQITKKAKGKIIYTDSEKFDELVKKNPSLQVLKQKFKLDFGG
ncbi:MAG: hypothetical protein ACOC2M_01795 [bacterium]